MTKVRVVEIHVEDGFYEDRERIMGMVGETKQFHPDTLGLGIREDGWFHGDIRFEDDDEDGPTRFFYRVKVEKVEE